jgi:hypothetical protein
MIFTAKEECYIGETLEIGLESVKDTTGNFVTSLGGGESMTYALHSQADGSLNSGSLTYKTDTDGTWHAYATFPSTAQRVQVKITGVIDGATRKFNTEVDVRDF